MNEGRCIRVLCVDDNRLVGEAVGWKLQGQEDMEWLGLLNSADELLEKAPALAPDVILLDVDMPGSDAFEAVQKLAESQPGARVVMLSGHVRKDLIERALDAGAWGYISKDAETRSLLEALRNVSHGEIALGRDVADILDL